MHIIINYELKDNSYKTLLDLIVNCSNRNSFRENKSGSSSAVTLI